jgi:hypothetical protein
VLDEEDLAAAVAAEGQEAELVADLEARFGDTEARSGDLEARSGDLEARSVQGEGRRGREWLESAGIWPTAEVEVEEGGGRGRDGARPPG